MVIRNNLDILNGFLLLPSILSSSEGRWEGRLIFEDGFSVCQRQSSLGRRWRLPWPTARVRGLPSPVPKAGAVPSPPGYIIYYSTDVNAEIHDWVIEPVVGNRLTHQIQELTLDTPYFFKIQARNSKGMGPMSEAVQFRTPKGTRAPALLLGEAVLGLCRDSGLHGASPRAGAQLWGSLAVPQSRGLWAAGLLQTQGGAVAAQLLCATSAPGSGVVLGTRGAQQELMVMGK